MLHQPLTADPDVEQAIEDFTDTVLQIKDHSAKLLDLAPASAKYQVTEAEVAELTSRIATRADRIGLTTDALLALINAQIRERKNPNSTPLYSARRSLLDDVNAAQIALQESTRVLALARRRADADRARLAGAENAYALFSQRGAVQARQLEDA